MPVDVFAESLQGLKARGAQALQAENLTENKSFNTMQFSLSSSASWLQGFPYWLLPAVLACPQGRGVPHSLVKVIYPTPRAYNLSYSPPCLVLSSWPQESHTCTCIFLTPRPSLSLWALLKNPREPSLCSEDRLSSLTPCLSLLRPRMELHLWQ